VADEPTGNLDTQSGEELMKLLSDLNKTQGRTIVMVTHDLEYLKYASKMIRIVDGRIENEYGQEEVNKMFKEMKGKRGSMSIQALEVAGDTKTEHIGSKVKESHAK
jgi:putative ABC transport system ATP-binding protein